MASKSEDDNARRAHFTYVWVIENASYFSLSNKLLSPTFVVQTMEMTKWHLEAEVDPVEDLLILFICREQDNCPQRFEIDFELTLHGYDGCSLEVQSGTSEFQRLGIDRCEAIFSGDNLFARLPLGMLTIRCRMWRTGCDTSQLDLCFARTHMRVEQQSFVWAIKRFSSLRPGKISTIFWNPTFRNLPTLILTFCLQEKDGKEYGSITVHRSQLMETHPMEVKVCILDAEGCTVESTMKDLTAWITLEEEKVCEFSEFFERIEILSNNAKFLVNDVLSLRCEFEINIGPLWSRIENYRRLESSEVETFTSEINVTHFDSTANACCPFKKILKTLYEDGTFSDISLKAGSQSFSVHKNILGARSPVFKAMFTKDMKKTAECIDIPDLGAETLRRLLLYIYTNRVEKLQWEYASDLFTAAYTYELQDLKEMCSDFLKANISTSNACDILVLADMHHDEDIRKAVQDFILQDSDIFYSDAWKYFKEQHNKLAFEIAEQIICHMRNSRT